MYEYEEDDVLEERVDRLETLLGKFIVETSTSIKVLSREMRNFKNEMKDFREEMKGFKDEVRQDQKDFREEMKGFKDEVRQDQKDFREEMKGFKDESRLERKQMNRQWGELANKMGTLIEDIVAPAVRPVVKKYFGAELSDFMIKRKRKIKEGGLAGEFDVIGVSEDRVFVVECKSSPSAAYLDNFVSSIGKFRELFPEYAGKKIIPLFASLRFEDDLIRIASERNVYLLAYREWDYMDILNFSEVAVL